MKYVVYCRKSSESDDKQALSIDSQEEVLKSYARREKLTICATFKESKSAKSPGRPHFEEMLTYLEKEKSCALLVWKLDRLARNALDGGKISWFMDRGLITEIRTPEKVFRNNGDDKFMMSLDFGIAKKYVDDLSTNVKRGQNTKVGMGWRPGPAPIGYKNSRLRDKGSNTILVDEEIFPLVRKAWDLMLTGAYTAPQVLDIATKDWGLRTPLRRNGGGNPISRAAIYHLFNNPFYYGWFEYGNEENRKLYKGNHKPMVTLEEFDRVQKLLGRKGMPRPQERRWFKYVGILRCGACGAAITAEERIKRQKNGNVHTYIYYHCTKQLKPRCAQPLVEEKALEKQIEEVVEGMDISPRFRDWALAKLRKENENQFREREAILTAQRRADDACAQRLKRLIDMRADEEIDAKQFAERKKELLKDQARLNQVANEVNAEVVNWVNKAEEGFVFATEVAKRWDKATPEKRREFVAALGQDSNLRLLDKKVKWDNGNTAFLIRKYTAAVPETKSSFEPPRTRVGTGSLEARYDKNLNLRRR